MAMEKSTDMEKVARQHMELDSFFAGDFTVKGADVEIEVPSLIDESQKAQAVETGGALKQISGEVGKCRKCELGDSRTNAVPGEGNPCARIFFVGEAPGADEDAQGRPFVGRAGKLLDKIIVAMGLKRGDVYIGNILK